MSQIVTESPPEAAAKRLPAIVQPNSLKLPILFAGQPSVVSEEIAEDVAMLRADHYDDPF
jgi:hypothetical protein